MSVFFSFFHSMKPSFIMYLDVYEFLLELYFSSSLMCLAIVGATLVPKAFSVGRTFS